MIHTLLALCFKLESSRVSYGETQWIEKLLPSVEIAEGWDSVAPEVPSTIVIFQMLALGNVPNAPLCLAFLASLVSATLVLSWPNRAVPNLGNG